MSLEIGNLQLKIRELKEEQDRLKDLDFTQDINSLKKSISEIYQNLNKVSEQIKNTEIDKLKIIIQSEIKNEIINLKDTIIKKSIDSLHKSLIDNFNKSIYLLRNDVANYIEYNSFEEGKAIKNIFELFFNEINFKPNDEIKVYLSVLASSEKRCKKLFKKLRGINES